MYCNTSDGDSRSSHSNRLNNCRYDLPNTHEPNDSSLNVIHTNCQSAMNKRSEISDFIEVNKPHILALTEFGASSSVNDGELGFEACCHQVNL